MYKSKLEYPVQLVSGGGGGGVVGTKPNLVPWRRWYSLEHMTFSLEKLQNIFPV